MLTKPNINTDFYENDNEDDILNKLNKKLGLLDLDDSLSADLIRELRDTSSMLYKVNRIGMLSCNISNL